MADGVWKCVYPKVFGRFKQLSLNKFFDRSTPSMRKGRDGGEKNRKKNGENGGEKRKKKTDENSGHYVICQQSTARTPIAGTPHARAKTREV